MNEKEGVIKFSLEYETAPALPAADITELNAWRKIMVMMGMIGQDDARYAGYGFGNISCRIEGNRFVISGTQTGSIADLTAEHYAVVTACFGAENRVVAEGPVKPSSESMTHGIVYQLAPDIDWVIHVHDPHIWQAAERLNIPQTAADIPYGTPEMSAAVERLYAETDMKTQKIFSMAGHEDGVVAFGKTAEEAGGILLNMLALALQ
ncbi:MAG: class II aldolase/adducin family protein [Chloroflexota bacterium]